MPAKQQCNGVECSVFTLTFCFHILPQKINPVRIFFDESKFRNHLLHCLTADLIGLYPRSTGQARTEKLLLRYSVEFLQNAQEEES